MFLNEGTGLPSESPSGAVSKGPSFTWISVISCHSEGGPATSTIKTDDSLGLGCTALFVAIVMVTYLPVPWQRITLIQGRWHTGPPPAFRRG